MSAPFEYMKKYHQLEVFDAVLGLAETVKIDRYYFPDIRAQCLGERNQLWKALQEIGIRVVNKTFYLPLDDPLGKTREPFFKPGFDRVFTGRGSPSEIKDVLRLAYHAGRIGTGGGAPDLKSYVARFITLDCNGFIGNFFNLSPSMHISNWANAHASDQSDEHLKKMHWTEVDRLTKGYLPLKPAMKISELSEGDVIITVDTQKTGMTRFKHIAILEGIFSAGSGKHHVEVVEYGAPGEWSHYNLHEVTILDEPEVPLQKSAEEGHRKARLRDARRFGIGWQVETTKTYYSTEVRYFFKKPCQPKPADWGRCGFIDV